MKGLRRSTTSSSVPSTASPRLSPSWIHLRSLLILASATSPRRGSLRSPWTKRKRKHSLSHRHWHNLLSPDGKFHDGGVKFIKKVRSGGVDPSIRAEVWPFLLGVYDLNSSSAERSITGIQKRKQYESLRRKCQQLLDQCHRGDRLKVIDEVSNSVSSIFNKDCKFHDYEDDASTRPSCFSAEYLYNLQDDHSIHDGYYSSNLSYFEKEYRDQLTSIDRYAWGAESSSSESSLEDENELLLASSISDSCVEHDPILTKIPSIRGDFSEYNRTPEDFATWQRIIRLDAIRANAEWVIYSPELAAVSMEKALHSAASVGLKDYEDLDPGMVYHAARMVAVLEAYAVYDPEIGYCQGMSDLLSPILVVMEEDHEAFWCFAGLMRKARQNFRLDETGILRQLNIVSKIIKCKDLHLYQHLEKLQAEDCCFVYRMVLALLRRELTFEQTMCLWEVMWADQAAIRSGIRKSARERMRLRAPPADDLLLYTIAACILQRRKLIIERYSSMDEIVKECNNMAGTLDVWRLLDDAHDLVLTVHQKI
ncbi:GTPase-activating protein gyp7-like [Canna indica]|uniref:GTPase-activating protein gyp7-like n=1 Tax=Canna indica TaxID=4628 RepID=A0AAQ3KQD6_9LILI|nr:GTPase-activating protein gyp7-like [Canna indica]